MTPAIDCASKGKIDFKVHKYQHDAKHESYGLEAAEKLGLPAQRVFKTLVVQLDDAELAVAVLPVSAMLNMKLCARALGAKRAAMAQRAVVEKTTGYVLGGVSPLGQKKQLRTVLDAVAEQHETIFVSAGRRGLELELSPADLLLLTKGVLQPLS